MMSLDKNPGFLHLHSLPGGGEWLHMCIRHVETGSYLMDVAMLDDLVVDALLEEDTRSRVRIRDDGIMVLLKAMHQRGEDMARPEDMVSIRVWIDMGRVITTREADVDPILELAARTEAGQGPRTPGDFLVDLVEEHLGEVEPEVERLEEAVDRIEQMIVLHKTEAACPNMADTQTRISGFLRHIGPQKPVLETLSTCQHEILGERNRARLDDGLNTLLRLLETLQTLRERIDILNDQVTRIQDRQLNRSSYAFAVAATIFLPLGFITGLFGVNLAGIPLAADPASFGLLVLCCIALVAAMLAVFKWKKWF